MRYPHTDKLRKDEISAINGYYNSQHHKIKPHKPAKSIVAPETPKERPMVHLHDIMTHREVAELLRVSQMTLKRWNKSGKINCIRINSRGDRRYLREEIDRIIGGTHV